MDDMLPRKLTAEFRHDLPQLKSSWGINVTSAVSGDLFFTAEALSWQERAVWGA